jgi:membrane-associated phospholipid phosphatase
MTGYAIPAVVALFAAGLVALILANSGGPLALDLAVRRLVMAHESYPVHLVAGALTELGSGAILYPVLVLLTLVKRTWRVAALPLVLAVGQVIEVVLLSVLPRTPPELLSWSGMSSGHTATAVLGWGLVALALGASSRLSIVSGLTMGVVVGATRVLLDLHWLSDVLIALLFGATLLALFLPLWERLPDQPITGEVCRHWFRGSRWAWLLTAAAALIAVVPPFLEPASQRMGDLAVYIGSAGVVGSGGDVYDFRTDAGLPFTYPPFAALLAEPLARIPLPVVQVLWTAATLAAAIAVAAIAMRPVAQKIGLPATSALLLISTPVRSHVRFGQVGLFLVLLVAADLLRRSSRKGWGVGLASAIKLTPTLFIVWLATVGAWPRLRASIAWAVGASLAGMLLLWQSSPAWLSDAVWDSSRFGANDIPGNQSVRGMMLRTFASDSTAERTWLGLSLVLLVVGILGARRLELSGNRLGAVGTVAATSVAISPISWQHHLVWLTLPLAALVAGERYRIAIAWAVVLIVPITTLGTMISLPVVGAIVVNTCGLTAVAATVLLPHLLGPRSPVRPSADGGTASMHRETGKGG